ncbi:MAG: sigma-54 dependent transcriptional regulator [Pseudomonadota bacterium]
MAEKILIVDDEPDIRELIGEILADEGYETELAADAAQARAAKSTIQPDLILLDVWMPDSDGISLLKEWREQDQLDCPVVMISGHGSVETAVEATRNGAADFIEKPVSMARLLNTIKNALTEAKLKPNPALASNIPGEIPEPIGRSPAIERLREQAERIAALNGNVLITGEPGSGRSTLARWLHQQSNRAQAPLIQISCGADLQQQLQNSSHDNSLPGTLLIDPVEWLDSGLDDPRDTAGKTQASAALQEFLDAKKHWRVIAVALPGIEQASHAGHFDSALFHRIDELQIAIPALRERREDIPELVRYFAERLPSRDGLSYRHFTVAVQNRLRQHDWPGNLRELSNLVQQLLLEGEEEDVTLDEVERQLTQHHHLNDATLAALHSPLFDLPLRESRETFERLYLIARLRQVGGSVGQLAEAVEMERTHLYRKLRQLGIDPKRVQED